MKQKFTFLVIISLLGMQLLTSQNTIIVAPGDNLITAISGAEAGDTIKIKEGTHVARYAGMKLDKDINIVAETKVKPLVYIKQFDVLGENTNILIEGIEFSGATVDSITLVEDLETLRGDYFINLDGDLVSCGDISVKNSIVRNINRALVRGDRAAYTVDNFLFDNIIVTDLRGGGDYGPFRLKSKITYNSLTITNSTFYNILQKFINNQEIPSHDIDILIKNCTFYKWAGGKSSQYLFDLRANDKASLIIQDCIFGKTNDDPAIPVTVYGWRMDEGNASYLEMITTAMTPDFVLADYTYEGTEFDKDEYNQTNVDPDWANPEAGDFTLPENSPLLEASQTGGIIGDPRWDPDYGVGINEIAKEASFQVYPNPADRVLYIELDNTLIGLDVSIYDAVGKLAKRFENVQSDTPLFIADLQTGLYFVKIGSVANGISKLMVK